MTKYAANCSLLFKELPLLARPAAAKAAGFDAVEFWWPFVGAVPTDAEADGFVAAIQDSGTQLIGLNFFAGDMAGGDRGLVSWTGREREFADNVDAVVELGRRLACPAFNALYGLRRDDLDPQTQDETALANLTLAAKAVAAIDGTVLLEPVSGAPAYPLKTAADVFAVLDQLAPANVGFLCDLYHLASNGDDLDKVIDVYGDKIAHVQVADVPGRHEPGTGTLDLPRLLGRIAEAGYGGWIAAEYVPSTTTAESFGWCQPKAG